MAELTFKSHGIRWPALARRVAAENPGAEILEEDDHLVVRAPYLTVTRRMVEETCFPDGPRHPGTITRILYGLALRWRKGRLVAKTAERVVIGDDDGERATTIRLRVDHQQAIARFAGELGMSRNEFVLRAIEHFVGFLEESTELPDLDGESAAPTGDARRPRSRR